MELPHKNIIKIRNGIIEPKALMDALFQLTLCIDPQQKQKNVKNSPCRFELHIKFIENTNNNKIKND